MNCRKADFSPEAVWMRWCWDNDITYTPLREIWACLNCQEKECWNCLTVKKRRERYHRKVQKWTVYDKKMI